MMVKICGITHLEDALAAVDAGAGALGFNFCLRSPRYVDPDVAARIIEGLPAGVLRVGVFVNETAEAVCDLMLLAGVEVAQLHGDEPPGAMPAGTRYWKAFRVDESFSPALLEGYDAEAYLLDSSAGGSGRTFDWERARGIGRRIILAGGLDASNVRQAVETVRPWGVDACSRLESAPGRKDHAKMREFVKAALA